jgi:hypothetical protein
MAEGAVFLLDDVVLATGQNPGRCFFLILLEIIGTNETASVEDAIRML